ncbi:MAG: hypothetical protein K2P22_11405 [Lachnospiraceae bacterium]|nr:hypothetical protein [Lachnospiraceae bacterium]
MKTMANCTPVEFLQQANKIRHSAAALLHDSKIGDIRKRLPVLTGKETEEEKKAAIRAQSMKNFSDILDALLEDNAESTAALIGMMCFQSPEDMKQATGMEYLEVGMELMQSKPVIDFLLMLTTSGQKNTAD